MKLELKIKTDNPAVLPIIAVGKAGRQASNPIQQPRLAFNDANNDNLSASNVLYHPKLTQKDSLPVGS